MPSIKSVMYKLSVRFLQGGFSQGGAISLFTGATCPDKLAGIFGLSAYLLMHRKIKDHIPPDNPNKDTPILMGHGDVDPLVKYEWGKQTAQVFKDMGWKVDFKTYQYVLGRTSSTHICLYVAVVWHIRRIRKR